MELFNYKRAVEVWMEPEYRSFLYKIYPQMLVCSNNRFTMIYYWHLVKHIIILLAFS